MNEEKEFVVVLGVNSVTGLFLTESLWEADGRWGEHPFWISTHLGVESNFLLLNLERTTDTKTYTLCVRIPHSSVVCVVEIAKGALPFAFVKVKN
ncbi:hypothetical protein FG476_02055 [Xylella fastidiosa subsp. multiplex]|uniref:Uncharacterized protein n=1 Tax=Xylella fastidiosa subsp. multiplex TaxID=644357 RepID=A0A9Q4MHV8_XYLFS|nr:hypothetical protein [Xylella fastidiosa]MBE0269796.1 hypothetical protein [Xylella fastidiosa subsp. multiplex]MBE0276298.1 hypothetical protein [Xylella fastidiosa subsp. multiplex]MBE0278329.1 hypothetical protein [Xylella fastidiosa subsp. multiplex]MBE0283023.1 hypothetical protein [Xylella fastidiosa subsp. multiplex]MRT52487.1 hypothetical protein [Xylella fastidiosa subsp. multiplex]